MFHNLIYSNSNKEKKVKYTHILANANKIRYAIDYRVWNKESKKGWEHENMKFYGYII